MQMWKKCFNTDNGEHRTGFCNLAASFRAFWIAPVPFAFAFCNQPNGITLQSNGIRGISGTHDLFLLKSFWIFTLSNSKVQRKLSSRSGLHRFGKLCSEIRKFLTNCQAHFRTLYPLQQEFPSLSFKYQKIGNLLFCA